MSEGPKLSVIVASYNSRATICDCLESLRRQSVESRLEVVVVDSSTDGTGDLVRECYPEVRLLSFPERKFCGSARNAGIDAARGEIVALVDADCTVAEDWGEQVFSAHDSPAEAIGGCIANQNPESYVGWAAYLCEFSRWMPGTQPGWMTDIAGASMTYKRTVFSDHGSFIPGSYCSDTELHWRLNRTGTRLLFIPSIRVNHRNIGDLRRFLRHEFEHGRYFARVRVKSGRLPQGARLMYAAAFPIIALKLFLDIGARALSHKEYSVPFVRVSPLLALGIISWSSGEAAGYIGR